MRRKVRRENVVVAGGDGGVVESVCRSEGQRWVDR